MGMVRPDGGEAAREKFTWGARLFLFLVAAIPVYLLVLYIVAYCTRYAEASVQTDAQYTLVKLVAGGLAIASGLVNAVTGGDWFISWFADKR